MTKGLRRRGLFHLPPLTPGVGLDLPGVFHVCFILRGLLFIFQALKREYPVLRINQTIGDSGSEECWESARPAVPENGHQFPGPVPGYSNLDSTSSVGPTIGICQNSIFFPRKNLKFDNLHSATLSKKEREREAKVSLMVYMAGSSKNQKIKK